MLELLAKSKISTNISSVGEVVGQQKHLMSFMDELDLLQQTPKLGMMFLYPSCFLLARPTSLSLGHCWRFFVQVAYLLGDVYFHGKIASKCRSEMHVNHACLGKNQQVFFCPADLSRA